MTNKTQKNRIFIVAGSYKEFRYQAFWEYGAEARNSDQSFDYEGTTFTYCSCPDKLRGLNYKYDIWYWGRGKKRKDYAEFERIKKLARALRRD